MTEEATKIELLLEVNSFNKPAEVQGKNAWTRLIKNLLFLEPGTYPSVPEMGLNIQGYDYEYMDETVSSLPEKIRSQVSTYLPDIPLQDVSAQSVDVDGRKVLLVVLSFYDNGNVEHSAIASVVSEKILDFEITE